MPDIEGDKLRGHLEGLVLSALETGEAHGLEIVRRLEQAGQGLLRLKEGSLYPALYRMERRGWISAAWGKSEIGQRIKVYSLTTTGRAQLRAESAQWNHFTTAVAKLMENT